MSLSKGFVHGVRIRFLPRIYLGFKVGLIFWKVSLTWGCRGVTVEVDFFSPFCLKMKTDPFFSVCLWLKAGTQCHRQVPP